MPKSHFFAAAAAVLFALSPLLSEATTKITPIKAMTAESEVSGEVTVVNTETRMLTIRKPDGVFEVLHAPPEVKRLDEVKIGDKLTLTKTVSALIELEQGRDAGAMGAIAETDVQRATGSTPGGTDNHRRDDPVRSGRRRRLSGRDCHNQGLEQHRDLSGGGQVASYRTQRQAGRRRDRQDAQPDHGRDRTLSVAIIGRGASSGRASDDSSLGDREAVSGSRRLLPRRLI